MVSTPFFPHKSHEFSVTTLQILKHQQTVYFNSGVYKSAFSTIITFFSPSEFWIRKKWKFEKEFRIEKENEKKKKLNKK